MSPSTRRAWIEIRFCSATRLNCESVALHPEGVDRNIQTTKTAISRSVALHPEGVDRNLCKGSLELCNAVALHPEGVDRNNNVKSFTDKLNQVALHPEGVDRNRAYSAK